MHQALRSGREAEQPLAGLLLDRACPKGQLLVGECIDVRPSGEIGQSLLIGDHDVCRLHPGDVELVGGAELAERHQRVGNAPRRRYPAKVIERHECIERHERLQLAVQCTDDVDCVRAALLLGFDAHRELRRLLGDVIDVTPEILEDHIAHLLRLLDRAQLGRQDDEVLGARRARAEQPGEE